MKKILALVTVLAMLLSMATVGAVAGTTTEIGDTDEAVVIDGKQWKVIRSMSDFPSSAEENGKYILAGDINVGGGTLAKNAIILGNGAILDGNGYSIYNFSLDESDDSVGKSGMFTLAAGGTYTIKNISFGKSGAPVNIANNIALRSDDDANTTTIWQNVDLYITQTRDGGSPGGFISTAKGTHTFEYCDVYVTANAIKSSSDSNLGGFVGTTGTETKTTLTFNYCNVYGNMESVGLVGGFVGYIGNEATVTFKGCVNNAQITSTKTSNGTGGFVGYVNNTSASITIEDSVNSGDITADTTGAAAGGFVGYNKASVEISGSHNSGAVIGKNIGGFVGTSDSSSTVKISSSVNSGNIGNEDGNEVAGFVAGSSEVTVTINNCLNAGSITSGTWATGFCRRSNGFTITDSANIGSITGSIWDSGEQVSNILSTGTITKMTGTYGFGKLADKDSTHSPANAYALVAVSGTLTRTEVSGNLYIANNATDTEDTNGAKAVTFDGAVDALKAKFPKLTFVADAENGVITLAPVSVVGAQLHINDTSKVRVLGIVDSLDYEGIGFKYTIKDVNDVEVASGVYYCKNVYSSVLETSENGDAVVATAGEYGGAYIFALTFNGVEVGDVITVQAVIDGNATVAGSEMTFTHEGTTLTAN